MNKIPDLFIGCLVVLFFAALFSLFYSFTLNKNGIIFRNLNKLFLVLTIIPSAFLVLVAIYLLIHAMVKTTMFLL